MRYLLILPASGILFLTCSCAGTGVGRPLLIDRAGATIYPKRNSVSQYPGLYAQLHLAEERVLPRDGYIPSQSDLAAFRDAGFDVADQICQTYVTAKADQQRVVNVWRDSFAPITALVTGAIPLISTGGSVDKDILQALSLTTSAASAGLDIYEQRYLFGTKNVEGVRSLVMNAMNAHATTAREVDTTLTYGKAVLRITEHQVVCSPSSISNLVTASIKAASPTAEAKPGKTAAGAPATTVGAPITIDVK